jgi:hypothetical protein
LHAHAGGTAILEGGEVVACAKLDGNRGIWCQQLAIASTAAIDELGAAVGVLIVAKPLESARAFALVDAMLANVWA